MMNMELSYGKQRIIFHPHAGYHWQVLSKERLSIDGKEESKNIDIGINDLIRQIKQRGLSKKAKVLIIIPDHTRRCRADEILKRLVPKLNKELNPIIDILIANGSHSSCPPFEVKELVGESIFQNYTVWQHVATDGNSLYWVGETDFGTPIWLNSKVKEADLVITIGGILYHYFAGFGGGAKMLLPGVAGLETIRCNHRRTIDPDTGMFHPQCREGNIDNNPIYLDLIQVVRFLPHIISLQLVLSVEYQIFELAAGEILSVHRRLCETVRHLYGLPIKAKADVVIASAGGYPADITFIQAHKSIHHAFQAVKENGVLIVLAQCADGIGSPYFLPYFDCGSSKEIAARLLQDYQINGHTALALKEKAERAKIILVSSLQEEMVQKMGLIPAQNIRQAWEIAQQYVTKGADGYIFPHAAKYLPDLGMN